MADGAVPIEVIPPERVRSMTSLSRQSSSRARAQSPSPGAGRDLESSDFDCDDAQAEAVVRDRCFLGEGSLWHPTLQKLLHINIVDGDKGAVFVFDPKTGENRKYDMPSRVGTVVPRRTPDGVDDKDVVVALEDGVYALALADGSLSKLASIEDDKPGNRFNDGKCDPIGRLWVGSMTIFDPHDPVGALYCVHSDGRSCKADKVFADVKISNGVAWSPDRRTMYYIDSGFQTVWAFDFDHATGGILNKREAFTFPDEVGVPDGCTVDSEGRLWTAHFFGGRVTCVDLEKKAIVKEVRLPTPLTTSVAFGGESLDELFVTSAREAFTPEEDAADPLAGSLFRVRGVGARGLPANYFEG